MPRTSYTVCTASAMMLLSIRGYMITTSGQGRSVPIATISPKAQKDSPRRPMVEYRFQRWPLPQPYIHDCTVVYRGERFRIFFQRHCWLPKNPSLNINGDLIILRLGKKQPDNVINLKVGDTKIAHKIARRLAPHLAWFQEDHKRKMQSLYIL